MEWNYESPLTLDTGQGMPCAVSLLSNDRDQGAVVAAARLIAGVIHQLRHAAHAGCPVSCLLGSLPAHSLQILNTHPNTLQLMFLC